MIVDEIRPSRISIRFLGVYLLFSCVSCSYFGVSYSRENPSISSFWRGDWFSRFLIIVRCRLTESFFDERPSHLVILDFNCVMGTRTFFGQLRKLIQENARAS